MRRAFRIHGESNVKCLRDGCENSVPQRAAKFCSWECAAAVRRQYETCTIAECSAPHLAKALCRLHYNQTRGPERYPERAYSCRYCGAAVYARHLKVYCSSLCQMLGRGSPDRCDLPAKHPVRLLLDPPVAPSCPVYIRDCAWCGRLFTARLESHVRCSDRCKRAARNRRRRARLVNAPGQWTWAEFMRIARKFNYCCAYCGTKPAGQLDPDHVVPLNRGGFNTVANLLPACQQCNGDKRDLLLDEWASDRQRRGAPPRVVTWDVRDQRYSHLALIVAAAA